MNPIPIPESGAVACRTLQWKATCFRESREFIAEETPVALVYNRQPYAVMLSTPCHLDDFARGFSLSEGIINSESEIKSVKVVRLPRGWQLNVTIAHHRFQPLQDRRRNLAGRTGCGLCGVESIDQAIRPVNTIEPHPSVSNLTPHTIATACAALSRKQEIHGITGAVHAAGWSDPAGHIRLVREDVGRHNALDKLIGAMAAENQPLDAGFVVITSRASSEIIQKAATVGINLVAAVSAPTDMAVRMAEDSGITLIGFSRKNRFTVYSHGDRITHSIHATRVAAL